MVLIPAVVSCAMKPLELPGRHGPVNSVLYSDESITVDLTGFTNQPRMTSRCWLHVRLNNKTDLIQKSSFRILLLDKYENTLKEDLLQFPSVLPHKYFHGVHYTFTDWTCEKIWTIKLIR